MWIVRTWRFTRGTQDGRGTAGNRELAFDDEPTAHRVALDLVERGRVDMASVERAS